MRLILNFLEICLSSPAYQHQQQTNNGTFDAVNLNLCDLWLMNSIIIRNAFTFNYNDVEWCWFLLFLLRKSADVLCYKKGFCPDLLSDLHWVFYCIQINLRSSSNCIQLNIYIYVVPWRCIVSSSAHTHTYNI